MGSLSDRRNRKIHFSPGDDTDSLLRQSRANGKDDDIEWDFGEDSSVSTSQTSLTSPTSPTLSSSKDGAADLGLSWEPGVGLVHAPSHSSASVPNTPASISSRNTRMLSRSISFAEEDVIVEFPSRARQFKGIKPLLLPDSAPKESSFINTDLQGELVQTESSMDDATEGDSHPPSSPHRKQSVFVKTHLPIQHALRFPGTHLESNGELPQFRPFIRRMSSSLPEALNIVTSEKALSSEKLEEDGEDEEDKPRLLNGSAPENGSKTNLSDRDAVSLSSLKRSTSRSSLASTFGVIKDKISSSVPAELKGKPEETRLRIAVFILFSLCLGLVVTSHVMYNQHIGELRLFTNLRLEEAERRMLLYDNEDKLVLGAQLGVDLPDDLHPYSCLPDQHLQDGDKCIEWKDHARLSINSVQVRDLSCHRLHWKALSESTTLMDCWPVGAGAGHWFGGGERLSSLWPLEQGRVKMSPFVTGDENETEWGNVIRKYFINSRGLSLSVEDETPLSVSLNDDAHQGLCLKAHFDEFPYYYHRFVLPQLNYTVCTDGNLVELYDGQLAQSFWDGHKDSDLQELSKLLKLPLWEVPGIAEGGTYTLQYISNYIETILGKTSSQRSSAVSRGYLLLNYHWQQNMGDIKLAPQLEAVEKLASDAGLTLVLTLNPFVSTDSINFKEGVKQGIYVNERSNSTKKIPALTWFKDVPAAALLDVTNELTVAWLRERLANLTRNMKNVVFFLDTGNTFHTPHYFQFKENLYNPDLYKDYFIRICMEEIKVIGVSGASSKRPKAPAFVHLTTLESSWESLRTIIPNVLNLGVIGYPFISPGPVGGSLPRQNRTGPTENRFPDVELYKRWWQISTFLPQLHFTHPPSVYKDLNIARVSANLKDVKENVVNEQLIQFGREAMEHSRPLIRPLWMLNPTDPVAQRIDDQFLIGDKILVAPVLRRGSVQRDVYLPTSAAGAGVWKRGTDGTFFRGGQWLNDSSADTDTVLYFIRQPDFGITADQR